MVLPCIQGLKGGGGTSRNSTSHQRDHSSVKSLPYRPPHYDLGQVNYSLNFCFFGVTSKGFQYEDAEVELACRHFLGINAWRHRKWRNQGWAEGEEAKLQQSLSQSRGEIWSIHDTSELVLVGQGGQAFILMPGSIIYVNSSEYAWHWTRGWQPSLSGSTSFPSRRTRQCISMPTTLVCRTNPTYVILNEIS